MPYNSTDSFRGHRQQTPAVRASSPSSSVFVSQQLPLVCPQTFCRDAFTQALTRGHTSLSYSQISILLCHCDASFLNKTFRERDLPVCSWERTVIYFCKLGVHTGCTDILWLDFPAWKERKETATPKSPIPSMCPPLLPACHWCPIQTLWEGKGHLSLCWLQRQLLHTVPGQRTQDLTSLQPHSPRHRWPGKRVTVSHPPLPFRHPLNHFPQQQGWVRVSCSDPSLCGKLLEGWRLF